MFITTKQSARQMLSMVGLSFILALAGCSTAGNTSHATVISETSATLASNTPTILQPTALPSNEVRPIAMTAQTTRVVPSAQANAGTTGAVQTVLDYYYAINQGTYDQAYHYWANAGAASHQSLDQFKQGFANTVRVNVQVGTPTQQSDGSVNVPLTLQSVVNDPADATHPQQVQQFNGSYRVQATGSQWALASANITAASGPVQLPPEFSAPLQLVHAYYDAINRHEFARAYTYWGDEGQLSKQTFSQFQGGFAATDHVVIELGTPEEQGAAGSAYATVPIVLVATNTNRTQQTFCGSYILRRLNVPPFDQFGWHLDQSTIVPTATVHLGSEQSKQLLNGGCK